MKLLTPIAAAAALLLTNLVRADELPGHLKTCVSIRSNSERLACFDKAIALLQNGTDTAAPSPENMFGANTELASEKGKREVERQELQEIKGVVTSLRRIDDGMIVVELDNGQAWRQQDADASLTIETGDAVTIMRASMGTFRIADKRGRSARFKRVR